MDPSEGLPRHSAAAVLHNIAKERALPDFQDVIMDRQPDPPENDRHHMTRAFCRGRGVYLLRLNQLKMLKG
jgi:hypothetical protein